MTPTTYPPPASDPAWLPAHHDSRPRILCRVTQAPGTATTYWLCANCPISIVENFTQIAAAGDTFYVLDLDTARAVQRWLLHQHADYWNQVTIEVKEWA